MSEIQKGPGRASPPTTPRWVKVFVIIFIILVVLFVIMHLMGFGFGGHGLGGHIPTVGAGDPLAVGYFTATFGYTA